MFKKFLLSILLFFFIFSSLFVPVAKAQTVRPWYNQNNPIEWYLKVYDKNISPPTEIFGERYTAAQVQWIIWSLFSVFINILGEEIPVCILSKGITECQTVIKNLFVQVDSTDLLADRKEEKGIFGKVLFEDRPLSLLTSMRNGLKKFRIIPEAQAQQSAGFGFESLAVVRDLWKVSRDVSYSLLVLAIIAIAFMIMFRVKISPQLAINIQTAIPRIMFGLILITLSYAIAGFLVDLMYVLIGLVSLLLAPSRLFPYFASDPVRLYQTLTTGIFNTGIVGLFGVYMVLFLLTLLNALFFSNGILGFLAGFIFAPYLLPLSIIFSIIVFLILLILVIWIIIRISWMLIKAFATILLLTAFAPIQILMGLITPNVGPVGGFFDWVRNFAANLLIFPFTGLMMLISFLFLKVSLNETFANLLPRSIADLLGDITQGRGSILEVNGWPPLLGVGTADQFYPFLYLIVSLMILFMIPRVAEIIKGLMSGKPFPYGTAIGESLGPISGPVGWARASISKSASDRFPGQVREKYLQLRERLQERREPRITGDNRPTGQ